MARVAYLFGAGASAEVLPVVENMEAFVSDVRHFLIHDCQFNNSDSFKDFDGKLISLIDEKNIVLHDLQILQDQIKDHPSIDTYAKKLYIKGENTELILLKRRLTLYMCLQQIANHFSSEKKSLDPRYDNFIASLFDDTKKITNDVICLSWNFDLQFEIAAMEYLRGYNRIDSIQKGFGIVYKGQRDIELVDSPRVIKLNGTSSIAGVMQSFNFFEGLQTSLTDCIKDLFSMNHTIRAESLNRTHLSFAWEIDIAFLDYVCSKLSEVETLVVIGYSFPFFNRNIDRRIIGSMTSLKEVWFQSKEPEIIQQRFQAIRPELSGQLYNEIKQFFYPPSL